MENQSQPALDYREGRILIVDDERDLVLILTDTLEARGYQVEVAYSAQSGREKVEVFDAQVALLDIRLGRDSGIDLITELTEARPGILCVMMTAYAAVDTAVEAVHRGAYDYLQKPLDMRYLLATLDRCFEKLRLENERARAEAEILRLQYLLQSITDSMPSVLIALDPDGRVLTWNPAAERLTGRTVAQMQGQLVWQICPELAHYRELFERVVREGRMARLDKEQLVSGSRVEYRDVSVFPLKASEVEGPVASQSPVEGGVLRIDDVTRRVQLEEMMLQSAKMASIGGLAAGVAHEINNPLGAMMQSAQIIQLTLNTQSSRTRERLQAHGVDPEGLESYLQERGLEKYLEGIRSSGGRAAKIVSDLLAFSRKTSSDVAPHDLNELVERTLVLAAVDYDLRKRYDFRDIEIVRAFDPDLPTIMCDGQQIQQVILNLVRNAAQAMLQRREKRGRAYQPRLTLRTTQREEWVELEVEDNGPGIPEAEMTRLFEPFFTTREVGEGTGLGLWLSWSIVAERHHGYIRVETGEEGGARMTVVLPIAA